MSESMYEWTFRAIESEHASNTFKVVVTAASKTDALVKARALNGHLPSLTRVRELVAACDCAERRRALRDTTRMTEDLGLYDDEQTAEVDCSNCSRMFDLDDERADGDICPACVRWIEQNCDDKGKTDE